MQISDMLPDAITDYLKLRRARRAFSSARYIRSSAVSVDAHLGNEVGIGIGVVVNPGVTIGDFSYVNRGALILSGSIGKFSSIAHYAQIGSEKHPIRHLSTSPYLYGKGNIVGASIVVDELSAPPTIGNDVQIGGGAIVQQGVNVGDGAVVAAGAVVDDDVEPYAIVAGVKARKIGQRFTDDVIERLLSDPWWDWPASRLGELRALVEAGDEWAGLLSTTRA